MYDKDLAKKLKERDNVDRIGPVVGTVVSENPLIIRIYDGDILATGNNLFVCRNATTYAMDVLTQNETGTATHEGLKINDKVAVMATENNQKFFVIDKLV